LCNGDHVPLAIDRASTFYVVVLRGRVRVTMGDSDADNPDVLDIGPNAYVSAGGNAIASATSDALLWIVERLGYRGQRQSGRIEKAGRLSYIDGCSDSMIVYPARRGEPSLNHLHFPKGIVQTQHLHPSIRMGTVLRGRGVAWGPGWELPLEPGAMFLLDAHEIHSFKTPDESMDVVAFHPDGEFGPSDENHAMINRTLINHGKIPSFK
jgi:quercetin dioxygenase-like cupin family protein